VVKDRLPDHSVNRMDRTVEKDKIADMYVNNRAGTNRTTRDPPDRNKNAECLLGTKRKDLQVCDRTASK
jgi:hypothetical protein